jgi:hypothetical protein
VPRKSNRPPDDSSRRRKPAEIRARARARGKQGTDRPATELSSRRAKRPPKQQALYDRLDELFAAMSGGTPVAEALRELGHDWRTFSRLCEAEPEVQRGYDAAGDAMIQHWAAEILTISDDNRHDTLVDDRGNERPNTEWINRTKLRVDSRKWLLSKLKPGRFGDRIDVTTDGKEIPYPVVMMPALDPRR